MTVAGEPEEDRPLVARFSSCCRFLRHRTQGVCRLGCGKETLGARKSHCLRKTLVLLVRARFHDAVVDEHAQRRCISVVSETAGVNSIGHEAVPQREHLHYRPDADCVAKVKRVNAARERGASCRFRRDEAGRGLRASELVSNEGVGESGKVGSAAHASDDDIRVFPGHLHLLLGFLPNDRLVQQDMVDHGAERILRVIVGRCVFDRLGYRDAKAARRLRVLCEDPAPRIGQVCR